MSIFLDRRSLQLQCLLLVVCLFTVTLPARIRSAGVTKKEKHLHLTLAFRLGNYHQALEGIAFNREASKCYTSSRVFAIKLWDIETRKEIWTIEQDGWADCIALSPDERQLATAVRPARRGLPRGVINLWDAVTGKHIRSLTGHGNDVLRIAFSPNGERIASSSRDNTVRVWQVATGKCLTTRIEPKRPVVALAYSPDGDTFAAGGEDDVVWVWDAKTFRLLHALRVPPVDLKEDYQGITCLAYSPDGKFLVSAKYRQVTIWDAHTGKKRRGFTDFKEYVHYAAFSSDGKYLAAGGADKVVRVWDVESGRELVILHSDSDVHLVRFTPDGRYLVTDDYPKHNLLFWKLNPPVSSSSGKVNKNR